MTLPTKSADAPKKKTLLFVLLAIFILVGGLTAYLALFKKDTFQNPIAQEVNNQVKKLGQQSGQMFENPINGMKFSDQEAAVFKDRKPIAVMVNNYVEARPSSGLSQADIVFEVVAEGGITRLMPIFYSRIPATVGSVRSVRYYFAQLAASYNPHFIHWGAAHVPPCQKAGTCIAETNPAVDAYDQIVKLGLPNLDGGNYSCDQDTCAFGRDPKKVGKMPLEHTAFTRLPLIYDLAKKIRPEESWQKNVPFTPWKFKDEAPVSDRGTVGVTPSITYNYWDLPGFAVKWDYLKDTNEYARTQGGVKQVDFENNQELRAKVVIIRFTNERLVNDKKHHLYHDIVGTGKALIFQDGKVITATWKRTNPDTMDVYSDDKGNEVSFNRGQIWVQLVPADKTVTYQQSTAPAAQ